MCVQRLRESGDWIQREGLQSGLGAATVSGGGPRALKHTHRDRFGTKSLPAVNILAMWEQAWNSETAAPQMHWYLACTKKIKKAECLLQHIVPFFFFLNKRWDSNEQSSDEHFTISYTVCKLLVLVPTALGGRAAQRLGIQGRVWSSHRSWICLGSCDTFRFYLFTSVGRGPDFLNCHQRWRLKLRLLLLTVMGLNYESS